MSAKVRSAMNGKVGADWMIETAAAEYAKLSRHTLRYLRSRITHRKITRYVEYSKESIDQFLQAAVVPATNGPGRPRKYGQPNQRRKAVELQPAA